MDRVGSLYIFVYVLSHGNKGNETHEREMGDHHPAAKESCTQKQGLRSPAFTAGFFLLNRASRGV
jgi:hypothetical protein